MGRRVVPHSPQAAQSLAGCDFSAARRHWGSHLCSFGCFRAMGAWRHTLPRPGDACAARSFSPLLTGRSAPHSPPRGLPPQFRGQCARQKEKYHFCRWSRNLPRFGVRQCAQCGRNLALNSALAHVAPHGYEAGGARGMGHGPFAPRGALWVVLGAESFGRQERWRNKAPEARACHPPASIASRIATPVFSWG